MVLGGSDGEGSPNQPTVFNEALKQAPKADVRRTKHERRTATALYVEIKAADCDGGYTRVTDFVWAWRPADMCDDAVDPFIASLDVCQLCANARQTAVSRGPGTRKTAWRFRQAVDLQHLIFGGP